MPLLKTSSTHTLLAQWAIQNQDADKTVWIVDGQTNYELHDTKPNCLPEHIVYKGKVGGVLNGKNR